MKYIFIYKQADNQHCAKKPKTDQNLSWLGDNRDNGMCFSIAVDEEASRFLKNSSAWWVRPSGFEGCLEKRERETPQKEMIFFESVSTKCLPSNETNEKMGLVEKQNSLSIPWKFLRP